MSLPKCQVISLEVPPGFEPGNGGFADLPDCAPAQRPASNLATLGRHCTTRRDSARLAVERERRDP